MSDIVGNMIKIADACRRVDGTDIPLGEQLREAVALIATITHERDEALADLTTARANARADGMEEAARIAEKFEVAYGVERDNHEQGTPEFYMNNSGSYASMDIAAAIRKAKENGE